MNRRTRRFWRKHRHWFIFAAIPVVIVLAIWGITELQNLVHPTFPEQ